MLKFLKSKNIIILIFFIIINDSANAQIGFVQKGIASFYHHKFYGRRTSSGERLKKKEYTAAHRKLLFNTLVRVTNLNNDKSVVVRINDRGPYKYMDRIIDLTYVAAKKIDMLDKGLVPVKIEVIGEQGKIHHAFRPDWIAGSFEKGKFYNFKGELRNPRGFGIQTAAFIELVNAQYFANVLHREGFGEVVIQVGNFKDKGLIYRVIVGDYKSRVAALQSIPRLTRKEFKGYVIRFKDLN
ncbi:MAG: septal ring lytic transglycosylase RlpA family protein [Bacteroidota bacterium]|nr:septal ring lytic transglycosylase RlpA family protein [Bacteroidota bacterium]